MTSNALAEDFESVPLPCKCEDSCSSACPCGLGTSIAYQNGILAEDFATSVSRPIVECSTLCTCQNCLNHVVQNGIHVQLQVFKTEHKGFGVKTLQFIPKLSFICEYAGELIDKFEAQKRIKDRSPQEPNYIYVLNEFNSESSSSCTIIDPTFVGNVGRYLNHCCSPNLIPVPVRANSMVPRICFFAKRDIFPHEELTYIYGTDTCDTELDIDIKNEITKKCYCESSECVGVLPFDGGCLL